MVLREFLRVIPCDTELQFMNFIRDSTSPEMVAYTSVAEFFDKSRYSVYMDSEVLMARPTVSESGRACLEIRVRSLDYSL